METLKPPSFHLLLKVEFQVENWKEQTESIIDQPPHLLVVTSSTQESLLPT